jgi:hypothetical protein
VPERFVGDVLPGHAQRLRCAAKIDSVSQDDGGDDQIGAGGAMLMVPVRPIPDLTEPVEEDGAGEIVARLALIGLTGPKLHIWAFRGTYAERLLA